jgi:hypothetical protein
MKEDEKSERSERSRRRDTFVMTRLMTRKEAQATNLERKEAQTLE